MKNLLKFEVSYRLGTTIYQDTIYAPNYVQALYHQKKFGVSLGTNYEFISINFSGFKIGLK